MSDKHSHYHKDVSHLKSIDVYRTLDLFGVTDQALGHAIKKLMCAGQRGAGKTFEQDVREAVDTLNRRLQMLAEDDNRQPKTPTGGPTRTYVGTVGHVPVAHLGGIPPAAPKQYEHEATHRDGGGSKFKQDGTGRWLQWGLDSWFTFSADPTAVPKGLQVLPQYDGHD